MFGSQNNGGVGINIGRNKHYFDSSSETVRLEFDDGTEGEALVRKNSWGNCTHLIDESIGKWARHNGLWERKLETRSTPVWLRIIKKKMFEVRATPPTC